MTIPDDYFAPENLDPELVPWLCESEFMGTVLKHPLVFDVPHHDIMNRQSNLKLAYKKEALIAARAEKNWYTFMFLHERPYRIDALLEIAEEIDDPQVYWNLVEALWTDTENLHEWADRLDDVFFGAWPDSQAMMMDEEELTALEEMADTITVYRGHSGVNGEGWSWTIDRERAEWFARRFSHRGQGFLAFGKVDKANVIAFLTGRNESEIVADPADVKVYRTAKVKP